MLRRIRQLRLLSMANRCLLARAYVYLLLVELSLRLRGPKRVLDLKYAPGPVCSITHAEVIPRALVYAHWLRVAARHHVVRAQCLHQAAALHAWLKRDGISSTLHIGVAKDGPALRAHAWVEVQGHVVGGSAAQVAGFTPLTPAAGRGWSLAPGETSPPSAYAPVLQGSDA